MSLKNRYGIKIWSRTMTLFVSYMETHTQRLLGWKKAYKKDPRNDKSALSIIMFYTKIFL